MMPKLTVDAYSWQQIRKLATATERKDAAASADALRGVLTEIHPAADYSRWDLGRLYAAAFGALSYAVAHQIREDQPRA